MTTSKADYAESRRMIAERQINLGAKEWRAVHRPAAAGGWRWVKGSDSAGRYFQHTLWEGEHEQTQIVKRFYVGDLDGVVAVYRNYGGESWSSEIYVPRRVWVAWMRRLIDWKRREGYRHPTRNDWWEWVPSEFVRGEYQGGPGRGFCRGTWLRKYRQKSGRRWVVLTCTGGLDV